MKEKFIIDNTVYAVEGEFVNVLHNSNASFLQLIIAVANYHSKSKSKSKKITDEIIKTKKVGKYLYGEDRHMDDEPLIDVMNNLLKKIKNRENIINKCLYWVETYEGNDFWREIYEEWDDGFEIYDFEEIIQVRKLGKFKPFKKKKIKLK